MDELDVLFAGNRGVFCFYLLMVGFLFICSKALGIIHIRQVFCLSRRQNMEYVRKRCVASSVCFAAAGILLYEILSLVRGYAHITPALAAFFFTGAAFVVFWLCNCAITKDVGQTLISVWFVTCIPFMVMIAIVKGHVVFDRYLAYAAPVLAIFAGVQYKRFVDGWKRGDRA